MLVYQRVCFFYTHHNFQRGANYSLQDYEFTPFRKHLAPLLKVLADMIFVTWIYFWKKSSLNIDNSISCFCGHCSCNSTYLVIPKRSDCFQTLQGGNVHPCGRWTTHLRWVAFTLRGNHHIAKWWAKYSASNLSGGSSKKHGFLSSFLHVSFIGPMVATPRGCLRFDKGIKLDQEMGPSTPPT